MLVDTYDIANGIRTAVEVAGPELGAIRIDSGDLSVLRRTLARNCWTPSARPTPSIIVSGDLDEYAIAALAAEPVDAYGAGTAVVTGSGAPTAGLIYKLVEVDGRPVVKRSEHEVHHRRTARRRSAGTSPPAPRPRRSSPSRGTPPPQPHDRALQRPILRAGASGGRPTLPCGLQRAPAGRC